MQLGDTDTAVVVAAVEHLQIVTTELNTTEAKHFKCSLCNVENFY